VTSTHLITRALAALFAVLILTYIADYLILRIRLLHPSPTSPLETMTRTRVLAIPMKNGKYEFQIDEQNPHETLTCVHALFPHFANEPCWYLKPRLKEPIKVN
jgi:hypothetical protein